MYFPQLPIHKQLTNPELFSGGLHADERGSIYFFNEFNLAPSQRFYLIEPKDPSVIRAWQGHKKEAKWFYVLSGSFLICLVKIDDWINPSIDLPVVKYQLSTNKEQILYIPPGYANGFKSLEENSKLLVFSNLSLEQSKKDDYRFDRGNWFNWKY